MKKTGFLKSVLLLGAMLALSGCFDEKERAERYYQSAIAQLSEDNREAAMIELRNALKNDATHAEARRLFAEILLEDGKLSDAYRQYLRLIEQYPNTVDVRRLLAEIALDTGAWDEVKRHGREAFALEPENPDHVALMLIIEYTEAKRAGDLRKAADQADQARVMLDADPDLRTALRLMIDWTATGPEPASALPYIERLLTQYPESKSLLLARLRALEAAGRDADVGAGLRAMYDIFPEDDEISELALQWYYSRRAYDEAEAFLREKAGPDNENPEAHMVLARFLQQIKGPAAAIVEMDRLAAANGETDLGLRYAAQAALIRFNTGAVRTPDTLQAIVERIQGEELRNDGLVTLARVQRELGQLEAAAATIERVLTSDPYHVDALITRAGASIAAGDPTTAINDLRAALDQAPRNLAAVMILAEAQQRLGNVELAEQRLAQGVEISQSAPQPSIIFARFQDSRGKTRAAERIMRETVAKHIDNLEAVALLADLQLRLGDNAAARNLLARLVDSNNPAAAPLIRNLQATILFKENRIDDSLDFLRNSLDEDGDGFDDLGAELQILRIQMLSGRFDEARALLDELTTRFPDSRAIQIIEGNLLSLVGDFDGAIALFTDLLAEDPTELILIQRLYALLRQTGDIDKASALLATSLELQPEATPLILLQALEWEANAEIDKALARYETLYETESENLTVINNYASMLAYYREDPESLAQAERIAAPLVGSNVPAFLDTLGYIKLRQGELPDAILNFQVAARGLPDNPTVAFNLAVAYARAGRPEEARRELERGFALAGDNERVPKLDAARALAAELSQ